MGNDNAKEKEKGGYSLQGSNNSGPSGHVDSEQERQARAAAAEARANKAKPKKVQAGVRAAHFDRYEEIERQAQNRGADRKTPRSPSEPVKCPACAFTAADEVLIASHIETAHPVDPEARDARLKATENRLNPKPSSPSSGSRPTSASPSSAASADTISCPMCGRSNFQSEAAVDVHIEKDHGATAGEREQRAKVVEERLKKSQRGGAAKQQQRKDENWQKYASLGGVAPVETKTETKTTEELARELDVEQAIKRFSSHIGRPEIVQASAKFISNILSKVANPPEPEQAEKYRKVNISNEKVREKIVNVDGALEVLESIGFKIVTLPSASGNAEDYLLIQNPDKSLVEFAIQKLSSVSGQ